MPPYTYHPVFILKGRSMRGKKSHRSRSRSIRNQR